jgi:hypothetical protein
MNNFNNVKSWKTLSPNYESTDFANARPPSTYVDVVHKSDFEDLAKQLLKANIKVELYKEQLELLKKHHVALVMDLFFALRAIKGSPRLKDLVKLAKRIKGINSIKK